MYKAMEGAHLHIGLSFFIVLSPPYSIAVAILQFSFNDALKLLENMVDYEMEVQ